MRPLSVEALRETRKRIRVGAQRVLLEEVARAAEKEQQMRMQPESTLTEKGLFGPMARCIIVEGVAISLGSSPEDIQGAVRRGQSKAPSNHHTHPLKNRATRC